MKWHIEKFLSSLSKIDLIITSTEKNKKRLIKWGVKNKQISVVPIGVDSNIFIKMKNELKINFIYSIIFQEIRLLLVLFKRME